MEQRPALMTHQRSFLCIEAVVNDLERNDWWIDNHLADFIDLDHFSSMVEHTEMQWTGASERTVKNWLAGANGPSRQHLIAIIRHSDAVFASVMLLAGRNEVAAAKKLVDTRDALVAMLEIIVDLTA